MAKNEAPIFFATPTEFRAWLRAHHKKADAQWVGFYRRKFRTPEHYLAGISGRGAVRGLDRWAAQKHR